MNWCLTATLVFAAAGVQATPLQRAQPTASSADGATGLWRVRTPTTLPAGYLMLGLAAEFNRERGLIPGRGAIGRYVGRLHLSGVPVRGLQIYGGFSVVATESELSTHGQTLTAGNPYLGLRYGRQLNPRWAFGAGFVVQVPSGLDGGLLAFAGTSLDISATVAFRPVSRFRLALELGYRRDNTSEIFPAPLTPFQAYSASVQPSDLLRMQLGASYRVQRVEPFLELGLELPILDGATAGTWPSWLTLGVRGWPLKNRRFYLQAGVDIGLTGVGEASGPLIPNRRYNVFLMAGWVLGGGPVRVVKVQKVKVLVRAPCPKLPSAPKVAGGVIQGRVIDVITGKPIRGARVTLAPGTPRRMTLLTRSPTGDFSSCRVKPGPIKLRVAKAGFRPMERVILIKDGQRAPVKIVLERAKGQSYGVVKGVVHGLRGKALAAAVTIPTRGMRTTASKKTGHFHFKLLTGTFDVLISRKGYITQRHKIHLLPGEEVILDVELYAKK